MAMTEEVKKVGSDIVTVAAGQVWADNDKRGAGRTLRVERVEGMYAYCEVLTIAGGIPAKPPFPGAKTRLSRIMIQRMVPNSSGYYLLHEAPSAEVTVE